MTRTWAAVGIVYAIVGMLMCSCAAHHADEEIGTAFHEWVDVSDTVRRWRDAGLPMSERCVEENSRIDVLFRDDVSVVCPGVESAYPGCYSARDVTIIIPAGLSATEESRAIVHHAVHWLHECNWGASD